MKDRKVTRPFLHGILNHSKKLQTMDPFRSMKIQSVGLLTNGRILKEFNELRYQKGDFILDVETVYRVRKYGG